MRAQPGADHTELSAIEAHITQRVSLPLLTPPSSTSYVNTPSVAEHADAVRARLREYEQFGAVIRLPADTSPTDSDLRIQPLHVIIKAGKKPRLVIDLSRNLNDHLQYNYFHYSCVDDAVEASHPSSGTANSTCATTFCPSLCIRQSASTSAFASKAACTSSSRRPSA